jgi:hypothetical protein
LLECELLLAVLLVKFFLVLKVIFFKISERATLLGKKKKKVEGDRGERKRLRRGKEKKQENKKETYVT